MGIGGKAERRQITVLFCDLVDSSSLAELLDPEDYRKVLLPFHNACKAVVEHFGGRVSQLLGDGVLIVFGHPVAHEDDAIRAARAALEILRRVQAIPLPAPVDDRSLAVRIGIATGLVVTGDGSDMGADGHEPFSGRTPILAQRLQAQAPPRGMLISKSTYEIIEERFECSFHGSLRLKGFSEPEPAWRVECERRSKLFVERDADPPLIGRDAELKKLVQCWADVRRGTGRAVVISGEAGIGKTRLLQGMLDRIGLPSRHTLLFQCESVYSNTALHPIIERIRQAASISIDDPVATQFDKLRAWHGESPKVDQVLPVIGGLLGLEPDERYPPPEQSAQRRREELFEALLERLAQAASGRHLVLVFEDLHWIDPTSDELVALLCERIRDWPLLLICTTRPDYQPAWLERHGVERIDLAPLPNEAAVQLAQTVCGGRLDVYALDQVVEMADGIPLFVEELAKLVAEKPRERIPARLQDGLTARLDQMGDARLVAQVAAVIGRQFSYVLMTSVYQGNERTLSESLRRLQQAELIHAHPSDDGRDDESLGPAIESENRAVATTYVFKHALLQKAAYETLLRDIRPELHRRTAAALEALFPLTVRDEPEVLAHHWTEAGDGEKAVAAWLLAGQIAAERCQYREAIARLRRGLKLVPTIANEHVRRAQELALVLALGPALITTEGAGTAEVNWLYARAMRLCKEMPLSPQHFVAHWGWWRATMDHRTGRARAARLLTLASRLDKPELTLQAHHCQWATLYMLGQHRPCCEHIERGLGLYDPARDRGHAASYGGHDARVCALGESGLAHWMLGRYARALERSESALQWADAINHVGSRLHAMDYAVVLHKFRRDYDAVRVQAQAMLDYAAEQRLPVPQAKARFFLGWVRALQGDPAGGIEEMAEGIAAMRAADTAHDFALYYEMLAEACELLGQAQSGIAAVREGLAIAELKGIVYWNAELHRRLGNLQLLEGNREAARNAYEEALACAQAQEARSLELRAAIALCGLDVDEAREWVRTRLQPVYASLQGAPDTDDLARARQILGLAS